MSVIHRIEQLKNVDAPIVLAAGNFDGVHLGHRAIIGQAVELAHRLRGEAWVLTFDPHPARVLRPDQAPPLITSTERKIQLIRPLGPVGFLVLHFTPELSRVEPEAFIDLLCANIPRLAAIIVGPNWTFGYRARGNPEMLRELAAAKGFEARVVDPLKIEDEWVSSSRIRALVQAGDLDGAAKLLGRPFSIRGSVVPGRKVGRRLGFPTANVSPDNELKPPLGIYAAYAVLEGKRYDGAAYLGERPTHETRDVPVLECYLFDFEGELYGRQIEIFFIRRLRKDRHFPDNETLKAQIARDVAEARKILAQTAAPRPTTHGPM